MDDTQKGGFLQQDLASSASERIGPGLWVTVEHGA
jgi:hypothetical protein